MGVYLKNKPSRLNYIVSNGILQFLLIGVLAIWLLFPKLLGSLTYPDNGLVELNEGVGDEEIDQVLILLSQEKWIDKISIRHISREEALSIMGEEIDGLMLTRLEKENPFRDVITFSSNKELAITNEFELLRKKYQSESGISGVYNLANAADNHTPLVSSWSRAFSIPLALLIAFLAFLYLNSLVQSLIEKNLDMIKSLSSYGSEPSFIARKFRIKLIRETFIGWLLGFILFIVAFYLILSAVKVGFSDIRLEMIALTVLLPLLLMIIFIFISVNKKISNLSKSYN